MDAPVPEPPIQLPVRSRAAPHLRPGERPLQAFVSSVMRGDLNAARQATVDALDGVPYLTSWAFEYTPPSSVAADTTYLRHVREADFVIWLAGPEVTEPVVNEVREAISANRRLIVITLGAEPRSQECEALLDEVRPIAKYGNAEDENTLREALELAIGDEIVRAIRGEPGLGRLALIEEMGRASRARCIERWRAVGLTRSQALEFADDPTIGSPAAGLAPDASSPVILLAGDLGAGKSICSERHHQAGITELLTNSMAPVPVWMTAGQASMGFESVSQKMCEGLGDPRKQGARIVVDGMDEVGHEVAAQLIREARVLADTWPATTVLITTRPIPIIREFEERREMPELSGETAAELIDRVCGRDIAQIALYSLPEPMKQAVRRPLFAILLALWYGGEAPPMPRTRGELLDFLGQRSVQLAGEGADDLLHRLAVMSVRRELGPVPASELGDQEQLATVQSTGLLAERSGGVTFGLPVLTQWYASQAILAGKVEISELLAAPEDLELWLYPLAAAVGNSSSAQASDLLIPLLQSSPGFAFRVIDQGLPAWSSESTAPPWRDAGALIRGALQPMAEALQPVARLVAPVGKDSRILPLAIHTEGSGVQTAYWRGDEQRQDVFPLPADMNPFRSEPEWTSIRLGHAGRQAAWAWRWASDVIRAGLSHILKARALPIEPSGPLWDEKVWATTVRLAGTPFLITPSVHVGPVLDRLEDTVAKAGSDDIGIVEGRGRVFPARDFIAHLRALAAAGIDELTAPIPPADLEAGGGWVGHFYSDQRLVEIAATMYDQAIVMYQSIVDTWFPSLRDRLNTYVTLPAAFVGQVSNGSTEMRIPVLSGYFEPLPPDQPSRIEMRLGDHGHDWETARQLSERTRAMRASVARWIAPTVGGNAFEVGKPYATSDLAYTWLWSDLRLLSMVDGSIGGDPRR